MKRIFKSGLSIFFAITIIFSSAYVGLVEIDFGGFFDVKAEATSISDLTFELNEDGLSYSVTNCDTSTEGELVIPETYNGLPITSIGDDAFSYTGLTSITIPESITNIGSYAFNNCKSLKNVYISDIGVWCNITFSNAFANPLYYAHSLYINGELATDIVIPDNVTHLNDYIFFNYYILTSVTIPDCVTSIGTSAFFNCANLSSVKIPVNVTSIGEAAFYNCVNLNEIYWNAQCVEDFVSYSEVFYNAGAASSGISLVFGDSVKKIPAYLFYVNYSSYNPEIITVIISDSVTSIGFGAFYNCNSITNVYYAGDNTQWMKINIAGKNECLSGAKIHYGLTEKIVPPKLKSIENTQYGVLTKWNTVKGADKYRVYRKTSKTEWEYIGYTTKTYYTDKTAKSGTKYYYAIKARNESGNSSLSSSLSKYYLADPTLNTPSSTSKGIGLRWSKVNGAEGYIIYRKTGNGSYSRLKVEKGVSNLTYRDTSAKKGKKYTYKVKAYYSKTFSAYSNTKTITDKY